MCTPIEVLKVDVVEYCVRLDISHVPPGVRVPRVKNCCYRASIIPLVSHKFNNNGKLYHVNPCMRCDIKLDAIYFRKSYCRCSKSLIHINNKVNFTNTHVIVIQKYILLFYYNGSSRSKMFLCNAWLHMESIFLRFFFQNDHSFKTNFFPRNWSVRTKVTLVSKIIDFKEIDLLLNFLTENVDVSTKCVKGP